MFIRMVGVFFDFVSASLTFFNLPFVLTFAIETAVSSCLPPDAPSVSENVMRLLLPAIYACTNQILPLSCLRYPSDRTRIVFLEKKLK